MWGRGSARLHCQGASSPEEAVEDYVRKGSGKWHSLRAHRASALPACVPEPHAGGDAEGLREDAPGPGATQPVSADLPSKITDNVVPSREVRRPMQKVLRTDQHQWFPGRRCCPSIYYHVPCPSLGTPLAVFGITGEYKSTIAIPRYKNILGSENTSRVMITFSFRSAHCQRWCHTCPTPGARGWACAA